MIRLPSNLAACRAAWRAAQDMPERTGTSWCISNAADRAKVYVFDVIGGWDLDAGEFVKAVHALDVATIDLHVNSPGGFVYDAVAMFEALRAHPAAVHTHVDGMAASAASFLALAGDQIDTASGSRWMIHDAQIAAWGSPSDLREAADLGDVVSNDIAGFYAQRAGGKVETWRAAMTATTWYSAAEAVDAGLADRVTGAGNGPDDRTRLIQARHRVLTARRG